MNAFAATLVGLLTLLLLGAVLYASGQRCRGWCAGWRRGYDEGHADATAGWPRNPSRPTC